MKSSGFLYAYILALHTLILLLSAARRYLRKVIVDFCANLAAVKWIFLAYWLADDRKVSLKIAGVRNFSRPAYTFGFIYFILVSLLTISFLLAISSLFDGSISPGGIGFSILYIAIHIGSDSDVGCFSKTNLGDGWGGSLEVET